MNDPRATLPGYLWPLLELHPAHIAQGIRRRDLAYACYLYFGLMLAIAFLLNWLPTGSRAYGLVADHFGATVLFGFLPAGILGVGSSILLRDRPLMALAVLTAGVPVFLWAAGRWPAVAAAGGLYFGTFTLLALALPLGWFAGLRKRLVAAKRQAH